jgi:hypothetical protein
MEQIAPIAAVDLNHIQTKNSWVDLSPVAGIHYECHEECPTPWIHDGVNRVYECKIEFSNLPQHVIKKLINPPFVQYILD